MTNALVKWTRGLFRDDERRGLLTRQSYDTALPHIHGNFDQTLPDLIEIAITCPLCIETLPEGQSISGNDSLAVGFTQEGLQVWCKKHSCNVVHIAK